MTRILKYKALLISAALFAMLGMLRPGALYGTVNPCTIGLAEPAFLASGVTPNVLLLIDNSASMYDLAYIGDEGTCFDDSFDPSVEYVGYFDTDTWYFYNTTDGQFEAITGDVTSQSTWTSATGDSYINTDAVYLKKDATPEITVFFAKGNFLNWATASKLDIEKKILTGGKYDSTNNRLVMESRGCLGRRFVRQVAVQDASSITYYLTLGVRPPEDAEKYDSSDQTTRIEIFDINDTGFDYGACEAALFELNSDNPNLGLLKGYVRECMGYASGSTSDSYSAFNHALQECWYYNKHGDWQPGAGTVNSLKNDCERLYEAGIDPGEITPEDKGYVCFGIYDEANPVGYVGRCWETASGGEEVCEDKEICTKFNPHGKCTNWETQTVCTGGGSVEGWTDDDGDDGYSCVDQAIKDFCGILEIPEVVDPSDAQNATGEVWNAPAMLIDTGVVSQLGEPLTVLEGYIKQSSTPTGLIQEFTDDLRIGAMVFNDDGSKSECSQPDPYVLYNCSDPSNQDGAKIISYIDQSGDHTTELVNAINNIKATSWTPIAEAMFNAIGYFTQDSNLRLFSGDFLIDADHDPITAWCQFNNILLITDGASTADLCATVSTFVTVHNDGDTDDSTDCGTLAGSTFFDDLSYYAKHDPGIYPVEPFTGGSKRNITTHIVVAGTPRTEGTGECSPDVLLSEAAANGGTELYNAADPSQLESTLRAVFTEIRAGAASGSAATVISSSRGGEGAIYQAIFWPNVLIPGSDPVVWTGEVHTLLVDTYGDMYEDTNADRTLDSEDEKVIFYYDSSVGTTKACYGVVNSDGTCTGTSKGLGEVKYLWSAAEWLAEISPADIILNRTSVSSPVQTEYISTTKKRYIFTWNDLDNDGIVDTNETLPFVPDFAKSGTEESPVLTLGGTALSASGGRGPVTLDFGHAGQITAEAATDINNLAKWIRGLDQAGQRSRQVPRPLNFDISLPETITWRLGDIVHSTPMVVAGPAEAYHLLYRDSSYGDFVATYMNRRSVLYFGGNDGMLHALNAGFYNPALHKFCLTEDCDNESSAPELGAELWAYVPYNLLPHLQCLPETSYEHKYYVDLRPRIFDVRIWPTDDATHINGWGTILVGGMRLGGYPVTANALDLNDLTEDYPSDTRKFISSYFILDITDPENPPTLLAEMTATTTGLEADLGYTTVISTAVPMKTDSSTSAWYLIFGSGPTELDGTSTRNARIAVLPLDWLVDATPKPFRIPDAPPTSSSDQGGVFTLSDANSFMSDPITVDFDIENENNYKADAVYFGTVQGGWYDGSYDPPAGSGWGGKLYRLVTHKKDYEGNEVASLPSEWSALVSPNPCPLIDVQQPVTAAPAVGSDRDGNYWVYFGTGRFLDPEDKTDASSNAQQTFYGIKEPLDPTITYAFTWEEVEKTGTHGGVPGSRGLLQVDQIQVCGGSYCGTIGGLSCIDDTTNCLPQVDSGPISLFSELKTYIGGTDGWYKDFLLTRERNLGQATLFGGLLTFTTYQPFDDVCMSEGLGFLYGVSYQTGTAWDEPIFSGGGGYGNSATGLVEEGDDKDKVVDKMNLGRGLVLSPSLHKGSQERTTAVVQTSTGDIVKIPQPKTPEKSAKTGRISWSDLTW